MREDQLILRTSIKSSFKNRALRRGTLLGALGSSLLVLLATSLPLPSLQTWGWLGFILAISLITYGLLPYRRLVKLETQPNRLMLNSENTLQYLIDEKLCLSIPCESLTKVIYLENSRIYGIGLLFKKPLPKKISIYQKCKLAEEKSFACDLFLPYFSHRSQTALDDIVQFDQPEN